LPCGAPGAAITAAVAGEVVLEAAEAPGDDVLPLPLPLELADAVVLALVVELLSLQIVLLVLSRDAFPIGPGMTVPCASP
jgi:hypothetical protein